MSTLASRFRPEWAALALNALSTGYYAYKGEPGKLIYWLGATIITIGLLFLKG